MEQTFQFLKFTGKRALILLVATILLFSISTGATIAYIITRTDTVDNSFTPPVLRINLQGNHSVNNVGNLPVYIRAFAVMSWYSTEDEHTISAIMPIEKTDYTIKFVDNFEQNWFRAADGFYYYRHIVAPGEQVRMVDHVYQLTEKAGYELHFELLTSAIQANTPAAIEKAWPAVTINPDGKLDHKTMQNEEGKQ